jgi:ribosomal protein S18 acetylase RimI-like enzyme
MEIFEATQFDLKQLSILFDAYRVFYGKESDINAAKIFISERLNKADSVIYIASEEERLVGFVQLYPLFSSVQMKRLWLLNDLFIKEEHRRKGVAVKLMDKAKDLCRQTDSAGLLLETGKDNDAGNALYQKEGFQLASTNFYYWKDAE